MIADQQIATSRIQTKKNESSHEYLTQLRSFSSAFVLILSAVLSAFLIQHMNPQLDRPSTAGSWGTLLMLGFWTLMVIRHRKQVFHVLTSYQFAVSILATSTIAVMLGTFLLQNASPEEYLKDYGRPLTLFLYAFFLNDLFHSFWFASLMLLIGASLFCVLLKRNPFRLTQVGFLFSHGGIMLILAGALIGSFKGQTGMIHLNEGMAASSMAVVDKNVYTGKTRDLGFTVRLERFEVDYYPDDYKLYAYRLDHKTGRYRVIGSYKLKKGGKHSLPGFDISFRIQSVTTGDAPRVNLEIDSPEGMQQAVVTDQVETTLFLKNGEIALDLHRNEKEAKEYRSFVSIWENNRELKHALIQVNGPLKHNGFSLYQANYDPENPTYSGLQVVKDPGLGGVYAGFIMMSAGVIFIFYIRPRLVETARKKQERSNVR